MSGTKVQQTSVTSVPSIFLPIILNNCHLLRAVPEIILGDEWVGHRRFFVLWGGGCFVDSVSEGWGVTCPGGQGIFDPQ